MEDGKRGKSNVERQAIDEDILFLTRMKTDRIAFYIGKDQHTAKEKQKSATTKKRKFIKKSKTPKTRTCTAKRIVK